MVRKIFICFMYVAVLVYQANEKLWASQPEAWAMPIPKDFETLPNIFSVDFRNVNLDLEKALDIRLGKILPQTFSNRFYSTYGTYVPWESDPTSAPVYLWPKKDRQKVSFNIRGTKQTYANWDEYVSYLYGLYWQKNCQNEEQPYSSEFSKHLPPYISKKHEKASKEIPNPSFEQLGASYYDLKIRFNRLENRVKLYKDFLDIFSYPETSYNNYQISCGNKEEGVKRVTSYISPTAWVQWKNAKLLLEEFEIFAAEKLKSLAKPTRIQSPLIEELKPAAQALWQMSERAKYKDKVNLQVKKILEPEPIQEIISQPKDDESEHTRSEDASSKESQREDTHSNDAQSSESVSEGDQPKDTPLVEATHMTLMTHDDELNYLQNYFDSINLSADPVIKKSSRESSHEDKDNDGNTSPETGVINAAPVENESSGSPFVLPSSNVDNETSEKQFQGEPIEERNPRVDYFMQQWVQYFCELPGKKEIGTQTAANLFLKAINQINKSGTPNEYLAHHDTSDATIKDFCSRLLGICDLKFTAKDVENWMRRNDRVRQELIQNRFEKGVYNLQCVAEVVEVKPKFKNQWVNSAYLWDEVIIEGWDDVTRDGKIHRWGEFNSLKEYKFNLQAFSYADLKELYLEKYSGYKKLFGDYTLVLQDLEQKILYWRQEKQLDPVFFPEAQEEPQKKPIKNCILTFCGLEDQWITPTAELKWEEGKKRAVEVQWEKEKELKEWQKPLKDVENAILFKNYLTGSSLVLPFNPNKLKMLNLENNKIKHTDFLRAFGNLEFLSLSGNEIETMTLWATLSKLKTLNLADNKLTSFVIEPQPTSLKKSGWGWRTSEPEQPKLVLEILDLKIKDFKNKSFRLEMLLEESANFWLLPDETKVYISLDQDSHTNNSWKDLFEYLKKHAHLLSDGVSAKGSVVVKEEEFEDVFPPPTVVGTLPTQDAARLNPSPRQQGEEEFSVTGSVVVQKEEFEAVFPPPTHAVTLPPEDKERLNQSRRKPASSQDSEDALPPKGRSKSF